MTENGVFNWLVGWFLILLVLILFNKTRLGHVLIYYSLMLIILLILVTQYQTIVPYLSSISTIGQLNAGG